MIERAITLALVVLAALVVARRIYRSATGKGGCSGCQGCAKPCDAKPRNPGGKTPLT